MDEKMIRLMSQFGLIAVTVWVVAAMFGDSNNVKLIRPVRPPVANGGVWNHTPVVGPMAAPGLAFSPSQLLGS